MQGCSLKFRQLLLGVFKKKTILGWPTALDLTGPDPPPCAEQSPNPNFHIPNQNKSKVLASGPFFKNSYVRMSRVIYASSKIEFSLFVSVLKRLLLVVNTLVHFLSLHI